MTTDKEYDWRPRENVEFKWNSPVKPFNDETKVSGARCVIFSTPMKAPVLDEKGKAIKEPENLIQNQDVDDKKRE